LHIEEQNEVINFIFFIKEDILLEVGIMFEYIEIKNNVSNNLNNSNDL